MVGHSSWPGPEVNDARDGSLGFNFPRPTTSLHHKIRNWPENLTTPQKGIRRELTMGKSYGKLPEPYFPLYSSLYIAYTSIPSIYTLPYSQDDTRKTLLRLARTEGSEVPVLCSKGARPAILIPFLASGSRIGNGYLQ